MNIFKQFIKSIYSPKDISTYRNQKMGKTILYIFFLSLLATIPLYITFVQVINDVYESTVTTINEDLPEFTIEDGQLVSDRTEPLTISDGGFVQIVFDSTGQISANEVETNMSNTLALLKNDIVFNVDGQSETMSYTSMSLTNVTRADIQEFLELLGPLLTIFYVIFFFLFYLFKVAGQLITISFLALIGLLFKSILNKPITYGHAWKISAYAITLATVFFMIMNYFQAIVPFGNFINWMVMIIMLYLSIKEIPKQPEDKLENNQ